MKWAAECAHVRKAAPAIHKQRSTAPTAPKVATGRRRFADQPVEVR